MNRQFKKTMEEIGAKTEVCFRVVFADGSSWQNHERRPDATIIIRSARAAWRGRAFARLRRRGARIGRQCARGEGISRRFPARSKEKNRARQESLGLGW